MPTSSKGCISQTEVQWGDTGSPHTAGTCRTLHPTKADAHIPPAHTTRPPAETTCQATTSLIKFKKIEIIANIFPDQKGKKLEIGREEKPGTPRYLELEPQSQTIHG